MTEGTGVVSAGPVSQRGRAARTAVRAGLDRGRIELWQSFTIPGDAIQVLIFAGTSIGAMLAARSVHVPGTHFSLGSTILAGLLAMMVAFNGLSMLGAQLIMEREDGTLLRAKATPNGMLGYLIGRMVWASGLIVFYVLALLIAGLVLFTGLPVGHATTWLTLAWVLALGLLATLPTAAVLGSLFSSVRAASLMMLGNFGLIAISGIFFPITRLPAWLQWVGQAFPLYWLGLGMRSALLPGNQAVVEIGHSWRHLATVGVLAAWAVAGLVLAPVLLRRSARREAGSSLAARRERAMVRYQ
jgi:ABC-2 type transport system permease protein